MNETERMLHEALKEVLAEILREFGPQPDVPAIKRGYEVLDATEQKELEQK